MRCDSDHTRFLLSAYLDGELSEKDQSAVTIHLKTCEDCRALMTDLQETKSAVHAAFSAEPVPEVDFTGMWDRIRDNVRTFEPRRQGGLRRYFKRPAFLVPAGGAVAALLLVLSVLPITREQRPAQLTKIESVSPQSGSVLLLETHQSRQPLIWIIPES